MQATIPKDRPAEVSFPTIGGGKVGKQRVTTGVFLKHPCSHFGQGEKAKPGSRSQKEPQLQGRFFPTPEVGCGSHKKKRLQGCLVTTPVVAPARGFFCLEKKKTPRLQGWETATPVVTAAPQKA